MTKLDLKDIYPSVPIYSSPQRFLQFQIRDQLQQFKVSSAPCTFTKLLKPVVATTRKLGSRTILYLDDMLIMAESMEKVRRHLAMAIELLTGLGFIVNVKKSILVPTQELEFLGFCLNSQDMTITLRPTVKAVISEENSNRADGRQKSIVWELACLLGMMVASHPAVLPAPLYF